MPYAIAHPLAVIPLARAMGRHAVPSALAIGSVVPDAWYLVPGLGRAFSHNASGLLLFCLPAGLLLYVLFHALLKEPLLSLLPESVAQRARSYSCKGFPRASWPVVCANLVAGAATHQAWDAFTHAGRLSRGLLPALNSPLLGVEAYRWLQHASTLLGTALLAWWILRKLQSAPALPGPRVPYRMRVGALSAIIAATAMAIVGAWLHVSSPDLRHVLRAVAAGGAAGFGAALFLYALFFRLKAAGT